MSFTMGLEIEYGATLNDIAKSLSTLEENCELERERLDVNFKSSGCQLSIRRLICPEEIVAEGCPMSWKVGLRGAFHCRAANLAESWRDIKSFLQVLCLIIDSGFILSFQYEDIYAIRDAEGLSFRKSMID